MGLNCVLFTDCATNYCYGQKCLSKLGVGGQRNYSYTVRGTIYRIHVYSAVDSNTFTATRNGVIDILMVGGGG